MCKMKFLDQMSLLKQRERQTDMTQSLSYLHAQIVVFTDSVHLNTLSFKAVMKILLALN